MKKVQVIVKLIIFSIWEESLKVYLRNNKLPFDTPRDEESLEAVVERVLEEQIDLSLSDSYLEQLYTFSYSQKTSSFIAVTYFLLLPEYLISKENKGKNWVDCKNLNIDKTESDIVKYAVQRLRWKIEYTNVVYSLLPKRFTLSELQNSYEVILGRSLDKRNFRKKILSLGLLKSTGEKKPVGRARPAEMFSFVKRKLEYVEVL